MIDKEKERERKVSTESYNDFYRNQKKISSFHYAYCARIVVDRDFIKFNYTDLILKEI